MASLNEVTLYGNVGQDPEFKTVGQKQTPNVKLSVATTIKEETEWHNVEAWGKTAEIINQYVKKGSKVLIKGRLKTDKWEDQDGVKRQVTKVVVNNIIF